MSEPTPTDVSPRERFPARVRRWALAPFTAWFHAGSWGFLGFLCLGLSLDLLALPPGPLPILILAADAPFLAVLFYKGGLRWKRWAFAYGFLHFALATRWLAQIHPVQILAVGFFLGLVYLLFGLAIRLLASRRLPLTLIVGTCAVLEEMLRTVWMGGMPWPARSLSFAGSAPLDPGLNALVPAAAYVGAYGLSFLAGATSALVFGMPALMGAQGTDRKRLWGRFLRVATLPLACLVGLMALAYARTREHEARLADGRCYTTERRLICIQGNMAQSLKHSGDPEQLLANFDKHVSLSGWAVRSLGPQNVFGVLWPETMITWEFLDADLAARFPEDWHNQVGVLKRLKADIPEGQDLAWLLGAIHQFRRGEERHASIWSYGSHDSLFLVRPAAAPDMDGPLPRPPKIGARPAWEGPGPSRHDKARLVPGGEYTPLGELLPPLRWFRNFVSVIPELDPGAADQPPFRIPVPERPGRGEVAAGTVICFEIAFPDRCRAWRRAGAEVLLNAANYGWFGKTGFRAQIQAVARLRAAELGVTVVMAGNTGPTAFYDPLGRTYGRFRTPHDGELLVGQDAGGPQTTHVPGWADGPVYADPEATPYTGWGDWPWLILAVLLAVAGIPAGPRFNRPRGSPGRLRSAQ